jgi:hypothetical protein
MVVFKLGRTMFVCLSLSWLVEVENKMVGVEKEKKRKEREKKNKRKKKKRKRLKKNVQISHACWCNKCAKKIDEV